MSWWLNIQVNPLKKGENERDRFLSANEALEYGFG